MSDARGAGDAGAGGTRDEVPAGTAFQVLSLVEGLLFVGFVVTFSVGASRPGLVLLAVFVVLLVPTVVTYRRIQEWKARGA